MKISVCMAVYNGKKYIQQQLNSILDQLPHDAEIIIVDDASCDNSCDLIQEISDQRIKLFHNEKNLGVIKAFEKALAFSTGDIIFLSDQDDIWLPGKIYDVLQVFHNNPKITLVSSDAALIDQNNLIIAQSFFNLRGQYTSNTFANLLKNRHHGCVLSFRRNLLELALPFPHDLPMHDVWIGIVNSIYGRAYYLNKPLVHYRRHDANVSRDLSNPASFGVMLLWRLSLVKNIFLLILRRTLLRLG
jgi:glycosyltransferase involved in cell wall biosynthesis